MTMSSDASPATPAEQLGNVSPDLTMQSKDDVQNNNSLDDGAVKDTVIEANKQNDVVSTAEQDPESSSRPNFETSNSTDPSNFLGLRANDSTIDVTSPIHLTRILKDETKKIVVESTYLADKSSTSASTVADLLMRDNFSEDNDSQKTDQFPIHTHSPEIRRLHDFYRQREKKKSPIRTNEVKQNKHLPDADDHDGKYSESKDFLESNVSKMHDGVEKEVVCGKKQLKNKEAHPLQEHLCRKKQLKNKEAHPLQERHQKRGIPYGVDEVSETRTNQESEDIMQRLEDSLLDDEQSLKYTELADLEESCEDAMKKRSDLIAQLIEAEQWNDVLELCKIKSEKCSSRDRPSNLRSVTDADVLGLHRLNVINYSRKRKLTPPELSTLSKRRSIFTTVENRVPTIHGSLPSDGTVENRVSTIHGSLPSEDTVENRVPTIHGSLPSDGTVENRVPTIHVSSLPSDGTVENRFPTIHGSRPSSSSEIRETITVRNMSNASVDSPRGVTSVTTNGCHSYHITTLHEKKSTTSGVQEFRDRSSIVVGQDSSTKIRANIEGEVTLRKWFLQTEKSGIIITLTMLRNMAKSRAQHLSSDELLLDFLSRSKITLRSTQNPTKK